MRTRFFGQYLLSQELITAPQLLAAVECQEKHNSRLGEIAIRLGLLTAFEAEQVNALQAREDFLFGEAAIDMELLSREQVREVLAAQEDGHVRLGQAIEQLAYMTPAEVSQAVQDFENAEHAAEPELNTLPVGVKDASMAEAIHEVAHKLLLRAWGLANKPNEIRLEIGPEVLLSDRNVELPIGDELGTLLVVGAPYDAAHHAAKRFAGEAEPEDDQMQGMVEQFARLLAGNLASVMAERGRRIRPGEPRSIESHYLLGDGKAALIVPHLTQHGQVLVGLIV